MEKIETQLKKYFWPILIVFVIVVYLVTQSIANERINNLRSTVQVQISEQQSLIATIAEVTARNGADAVTESIVRDCQADERDRFDSLLSRLNAGLAWSELNELERLFGRCGSFSAQRKSVMVARLAREVELYEKYVEQLVVLSGEDAREEYAVEKWNQLAVEEQNQSELFNELVRMQDEIITTLLAGNSVRSEELQTVLAKTREVQESLLVANKQAQELRGDLISL